MYGISQWISYRVARKFDSGNVGVVHVQLTCVCFPMIVWIFNSAAVPIPCWQVFRHVSYRYDLKNVWQPSVRSTRRLQTYWHSICNVLHWLHVFIASPLNEFGEIRIVRDFLGSVDIRMLFKTRQQRRALRMTIRFRFCSRIESSSCSVVRYAHNSTPLVPFALVSWALEINAMELCAVYWKFQSACFALMLHA